MSEVIEIHPRQTEWGAGAWCRSPGAQTLEANPALPLDGVGAREPLGLLGTCLFLHHGGAIRDCLWSRMRMKQVDVIKCWEQ